ncbi:hypothetical protein TNCT6_47180 [Streptomyces sp. 6-11-2]|nr:hypothetical protein TNCT6_47180 [Streptomyces sp. 6-11-2]
MVSRNEESRVTVSDYADQHRGASEFPLAACGEGLKPGRFLTVAAALTANSCGRGPDH